MPGVPAWLLEVAVCPEDSGRLLPVPDGAACATCDRSYGLDGGVLSLLPDELRTGAQGAARELPRRPHRPHPAPRGRSRERDLIGPIRSRLPARPLVIEMGAGDSRTMADLWPPSGDGPRYVATDMSLPALEAGRRRLAGSEAVSVRCDAVDWPFREGTADVVLVLGVLHHLPDWRQALDRACRTVRPGGFLLLHEVVGEPRVTARPHGRELDEAWVSQHAGDFEAADLRAELEHRGAIQRWQGSGEVFVIWQQTAPSDPRRFYTEAYQTAGADERERLGRWRALGARIKVDHVLRLWQRAGLRPAAVAEIGCGDGSLLADLSRRAALTVLDGFDVSDSAVEMARARGLPAVRVECFDGRRVPAADDAYDVAILSHVVEHIEDPVPVLEEAARIAPWVLVEVPLEDNRSGARREKRDEAARIGHVLFLDRPALHELLDAAGLDVREDLSDPLPFSHVAFFADGRRARAKGAVKTVIRRAVWLGSPQLAERWFTLHYACLARRRR